MNLPYAKLNPPRVRGPETPRPLALQKLARCLPGTSALISAPAGYGKTTLAARWLESQTGPTAWLSLDPTDDDPVEFLRSCSHALAPTVPNRLSATRALLDAPEPIPVTMLREALLEDLSRADEPVVLVLDDYQHLVRREVHEVVEDLLFRSTGPLIVVLVTRHDPPLPLTHLRGRGRLVEIRERDLRLTAPETRELVEGETGVSLTEDALVALDRQLEGWVAGIRLYCLALESLDPRGDGSWALPNELDSVRDYLMTEVLDALPASVREALLRIADFERFCPELCEAVCPDAAVDDPSRKEAEPLEKPETRGLFSFPTGDGEWRRFHPVFRDLLRDQASRHLAPEIRQDVHRRASAWFAQRELMEEALEHALLGNAPDQAAELVIARRHAMFDAEKWGQLGRWLDRLPASTLEANPILVATKAWVCHYGFQTDPLERLLRLADQLTCNAAPGSDARKAKVELEALRGAGLHLGVDPTRAERCSRTALEELPERAYAMRGASVATLAWAHQGLGAPERGLALVADALGSENGCPIPYRPRALGGMALVHYREGYLPGVIPVARALLDLGCEHDLAESILFGRSFLGWSHYLRNDLETADVFLEAVVKERKAARLTWLVQCAFALALGKGARRQFAEARDVLQLLIRHAIDLGVPSVIGEASAIECELALWEGRIGEALAWAQRRPAKLSRISTLLFYSPQLTLAKARLARGTVEAREGARRLLKRMVDAQRALNDKRRLGDVLPVLALAQAPDDERAARSTLAEALALTEAGGTIRPFVDLGEPMSALLRRLTPPEHASHAELILTALDGEPPRPPEGEFFDQLTNREQDVLEMLELRLRDKEIADRLGIAPGTVKSHLKGLYQKLGVGERRAAVERGRDLRLLTSR